MRRPNLPVLTQQQREALSVLEHQQRKRRPLPTVQIIGPADRAPPPPRVIAWGQSNLPDGAYLCVYRIERDDFAFYRFNDEEAIWYNGGSTWPL